MANLPTRNNNPGDLRNPATGSFQIFANPDQGFQALKSDLQAKITGHTKTGLGPNSTVRDLAYVWAPPSDNNDSESYAKNLAAKAGVSTTTPISQVNIDKLAAAIASNEGYQGASGGSTGSSGGKLSVSDFAAKIKAKYPQYSNVDDNTLAQKVLAKYPQYASAVSGAPTQSGITADALGGNTGGVSANALSGGSGNPFQQYAQQEQSQYKPPNPDSLGTELSNRAQDVGTAVQTGVQGANELVHGNIGHGLFDVGSGLLQTGGAIAGGIGDVIGKGLQLIPGVKQVEGAIGQGVGKLAQTAPGQAVVGAAQDFAAKHPVAAKDVGAAFNIAGLAGGGFGAKVAKDAAVEGVGQAAREGVMGSLIQNAARKKAINDALEVVAPKETAKVIKQGIKSGRATEGGVFSGSSISPDARTIRAAEAAAGIVNKSKSDVWNANAVRDAISSDATKLETELGKERPFIAGAEGIQAPIVSPVEVDSLLTDALQKIGEDPTMVGNAEESAKRILAKFKSFLPQDTEIKAADILTARKKLDNWIGGLSGGSKVFDPAYENAKTIALRAIRQGANDLMAAKAPDVAVKELLAHQTALYDALDNIAAKGAKTIGKSGIKRFAERHPFVIGGLKKAGKTVLTGMGIKEGMDLVQ